MSRISPLKWAGDQNRQSAVKMKLGIWMAMAACTQAPLAASVVLSDLSAPVQGTALSGGGRDNIVQAFTAPSGPGSAFLNSITIEITDPSSAASAVGFFHVLGGNGSPGVTSATLATGMVPDTGSAGQLVDLTWNNIGLSMVAGQTYYVAFYTCILSLPGPNQCTDIGQFSVATRIGPVAGFGGSSGGPNLPLSALGPFISDWSTTANVLPNGYVPQSANLIPLSLTFDPAPAQSAPEPETGALFLLGLGGFAMSRSIARTRQGRAAPRNAVRRRDAETSGVPHTVRHRSGKVCRLAGA